jgi:hypothetical protein
MQNEQKLDMGVYAEMVKPRKMPWFSKTEAFCPSSFPHTALPAISPRNCGQSSFSSHTQD